LADNGTESNNEIEVIHIMNGRTLFGNLVSNRMSGMIERNPNMARRITLLL